MRAALILGFVLIANFGAHVLAAEDARANIRVLDADTAKPIPLTRIFVDCKSITTVYTDDRGEAVVENLDAGTCRFSAYSPKYYVKTGVIELQDGTTTVVSIRLAPLGRPKTIANITAVSRPRAQIGFASSSSPVSRLRGNLYGALAALPDITSLSHGPAIDGLSAASAAATLDGVPIVGGANNPLFSGVGMDLFNSVGVDPIGSQHGPGINLSSFDPTIAFMAEGRLWQQASRSDSGAFDVRGTTGFVGYSWRHVSRSDAGPIDGMLFADESGLTYPHADTVAGAGDLAEIRVPLSVQQNVIVGIAHVQTTANAVCARASGSLPCGFGPDNWDNASGNNAFLRYTISSGRTQASLAFSNSRNTSVADYLKRRVAGVPAPYYFNSAVTGQNGRLTINGPLSGQHDVSLSYDWSTQVQSVNGNRIGSAVPYSNLRLTDGTQLGAVYSTATASLSQSSRLSLMWDGQVHLGSDDTIAARVTLGGSGLAPLASIPAIGALTDVPSASYDCLHHTIYGAVAGDQPGDQTTSGAGLQYSHETSRFSLHFSASANTVHNAYVPALTVATSAALQQWPGLLGQLTSFYNSPWVCDTNAPIGPQNIVLASDRTATLVSRRATLSLAYQLDPKTIVAPYGQLGQTRENIAGTWVPALYVPDVRAGVLFDRHVGTLGTEIIGFAQYDGSNNAYGLPPLLTLDVGISKPLRFGTATLSLTNVTDAYGRTFNSSSYAGVLANGIIPIAQPLARSAIEVTYSFAAGAKTPPRRLDPLAALSALAQPASDVVVVRMSRMPPGDTQNPFEPDRTLESCAPEVIERASGILNWLRDIDASQRVLPGSADTVYRNAELKVSAIAHRRDHQVTFEVQYDDAFSWRAFETCNDVHFVSQSEALARGLYVPGRIANNAVFYDRRVGAYKVFATLAPASHAQNASSIDLGALPSAPPAAPLAIRASCPSSLRPLAVEIARVLAPLIRHARALSSGVFTVTEHTSPNLWADLHFLDPSAVPNVEECMNVAGARAADLRSRGIGATRETINFSPAVGLYTPIE